MSERTRREFLLQSVATGAAFSMLPALNASEISAKRTPIKIGQIGTGHAHASKLGVYRKSEDYEVVGIVEPDAERKQRAEAQDVYRDLPWMTTEQLLNTPGLQAVLVETDVPDLLDTAELCVAAGKHIHLDKPAGASLSQFRKILAEAERQQLIVQMGYMYRYNPGVVLLQELLSQGWLGEIFEVHTVMSKVVPNAERVRLARYSGGMMFELGCHLLDLVVRLLGRPTQVTSVLQHVGPQMDDLMDSTLALLEYPKATATVRAAGVEVDGGRRRHLTVCGTKGTFHIQPLDNPAVQVSLDAAQGDYRKGFQSIALPVYARYVDDAAEMARIIRGDSPLRFGYDHDLAVQETLLRASQMPV
ncbi:gfo/Idh/MocA family oxidoreductase [bacterium]|nr:gfo/Idh/MocA family oxidoreductase [bacterium]